jgi:hypothetical protein
MTKAKKHGKHGGRRAGGGRKPIYGEPMVRIAVRIAREHLRHLNRKYVNPSAGVRTLCERDIQGD